MDKIEKYHQEQLLRFENELSGDEKKELYKQIQETDFSYLDELNKEQKVELCDIAPIEALTIDKIEKNKNKYKEIGETAIKNGEVATLLLAGGMGTRLGFDGPKGMYDVGITHNLFIFECIINNLKKVTDSLGVFIPLFIMTSDKNDKATKEFFEEKKYFGYSKDYIRFFTQEMAPCTDLQGRILLESKNRLATSPNGNGGWFNSLIKNKDAKELLDKSGAKWINIFAVDNVLQKIADPVFIGATISAGVEVGAKVIRKVDPYEKVGVMCLKNGKPSVIEYMDLGEEMAQKTDAGGERLYNFGVILNYLFNIKTMYEIKDKKLPVHVVTKKIEHLDAEGNLIKPDEPNGHKFEMLCVDMIELASTCLPFEVVREKEFAPIKNKTGVDSVESARVLLQKNGVML